MEQEEQIANYNQEEESIANEDNITEEELDDAISKIKMEFARLRWIDNRDNKTRRTTSEA